MEIPLSTMEIAYQSIQRATTDEDPSPTLTKELDLVLEGETYMVRWHTNGLDLNLFHDLVGSS
jgi:hypothetical protein